LSRTGSPLIRFSFISITRIFNPDTTTNAPLLNQAVEAAAPLVGMMVNLAPVGDDAGIEAAIGTAATQPGVGLVCLPNVFNVGAAVGVKPAEPSLTKSPMASGPITKSTATAPSRFSERWRRIRAAAASHDENL